MTNINIVQLQEDLINSKWHEREIKVPSCKDGFVERVSCLGESVMQKSQYLAAPSRHPFQFHGCVLASCKILTCHPDIKTT